jgi:hypothetical protein
MSDNDGLGGSSSSNGGGISSDGGGIGAGHTVLSGAVEQADKAIRDMASAIIFGGDIDWNLLRNDLRRLANGLDALDKLCLNLRRVYCEPTDLRFVRLLDGSILQVPADLNPTGAFDPAKAENGDSQEDNRPNAD